MLEEEAMKIKNILKQSDLADFKASEGCLVGLRNGLVTAYTKSKSQKCITKIYERLLKSLEWNG